MIQLLAKVFDVETTSFFTEYLINNLPWKQFSFTKKRLACHMKEEHLQDEIIMAIITQAITATARSRNLSSMEFSGVFFNYYRDGNDETPFHKDTYGSTVITVSLGATRNFIMRPDDGGIDEVYSLDHGDVFVFDPADNAGYKHSIPKTRTPVGPRVSVVIFAK